MELGPMQRKWVDALRSDEYRQGRICLHDEKNDTYCCLGVANKVCNLGETNVHGLVFTYHKIGLRNGGGEFAQFFHHDSGKFYKSLVGMNDSLSSKLTFKEIADFIEQNPEVVFSGSV